jgi:type VI secretion system protein VasI
MSKFFLYFSISFFCLFSNAIFSAEEIVNQKNKEATLCTKIEQKIQRLTCFDSIFSTPIYGVKYNTNKPKSWIRATSSESKREARVEPLLTLDEKSSDLWITIPAINIKEGIAPPLLILSCISGISRIELALYSPLDKGRVKIYLKANVEEYWRSDDTGFLLSSRRGDFAKDHIKDLLLKDELIVHSDNSLINGVKFSTLNLKAVLSSVRERCSW